MKETKKNFTKDNIKEIRQSLIDHMNQDHWPYDQLDEHIAVLMLKEYDEVLWEELAGFLNEEAEWQRCNDAGVETFEQKLGTCENKAEIHEFTWFYVSAPGEIFPLHYHEQQGEEGKTKEWYFCFIPGKVIIKFCDEVEAHALINDSEGEMYVLSFKAIRK